MGYLALQRAMMIRGHRPDLDSVVCGRCGKGERCLIAGEKCLIAASMSSVGLDTPLETPGDVWPRLEDPPYCSRYPISAYGHSLTYTHLGGRVGVACARGRLARLRQEVLLESARPPVRKVWSYVAADGL